METPQVVLITGASTGIGRALAWQLSKEGCQLVLTARRLDLLQELVTSIESTGGLAFAVACDVTAQAQVRQLVAQTYQRFGRVDWALLSAGISQPTVSTAFRTADLERLWQTNLLGVAYCLEELIPRMRQHGGGKIAAISSLAGDRGMPGSASYCATKAALNALFDGLRVGLKALGIELVTIAPGYVLTPMTEKFGKLPFVLSAEEAARIIVRRLRQGERVIRFPWQAAWIMWGLRLLPVSWFDALTARRRPLKLEE